MGINATPGPTFPPQTHRNNQPTTTLATNFRQNKPLRIVIILQRVCDVNQQVEPAGTEQIARIAVRTDLARERLERLVRETRKHPADTGRAPLERLAVDVAGIAHEDDGSHCGKGFIRTLPAEGWDTYRVRKQTQRQQES